MKKKFIILWKSLRNPIIIISDISIILNSKIFQYRFGVLLAWFYILTLEWFNSIKYNWIQKFQIFFILFQKIGMEIWTLPESATIGCQSTFSEGSTFFRLTNYYTGLIWLSWVRNLEWFCGVDCLCFSCISCSSSLEIARLNKAAKQRLFPRLK